MEIWNREKQLFEFAKEFLIHGERSLHKLLTGENAKHSAYQTAEAMAYLLPRGADFVATVVTGWLDRLDKISRRNNRLKVEHAIDPTGRNQTMYKERLRLLLLKSAVEIFMSFELQFQFVFRRINDKYNSLSRTQAMKVLAEFASKACTKHLTESTETVPDNWHLHEAVLIQDKKLSGKIKNTRNQVVTGQDKLIFMLDNGQKIISKSEFFRIPIAAFMNETGRGILDNENSVLLIKEDVKRWKEGERQPGLLRRPFDFEWKQMMMTSFVGEKNHPGEFVNVARKNPKLKRARVDLSNFKWTDPSTIITGLNCLIGKELPLESIDALYGRMDNLIAETKENLTKTLDEIQDDLKTELLKNNQIVLKALEAMKSGVTKSPSPATLTRTAVIMKEIRFNIRDPIPSFTGRQEFLKEVHQKFMEIKENFVLSQVRVISGLGGIGKSETVRKYIHQYENDYHHIIWLDSETHNTMTQNFRSLAEHELKLSVKSPEGNWRPMEEIVMEVYQLICQQSSLFIFDNAECYEDWEQSGNGIKTFLPPSLNSKLIKPKILVTSRNQNWKLLPNRPLTLDILTKDESIQLIQNRLDMDTDMKSHTLADLVGGLPLSLQVAISSIHKLAEKRSVSVSQALETYIQDYRLGSNSQEFLHYYDKSIVPKSIFLTMLLSFEKIQKKVGQKFGSFSLKLMKYLAFFYSDEIPKDLIFSLLPYQEETQVQDGLALLKNFSLVKIFDKHITVHRQVQQVTIEKMKRDGDDVEILSEIVLHLTKFISTTPTPDKLTMTNTLRLVTHLKSRLESNVEFPKFLEFIANKLFDQGRYGEAMELYTILSESSRSIFGEDHEDTLNFEYHVARCLEFSGNFDEALVKYRQVYENQKHVLGVASPAVWKTLSKIASVSHIIMENNNNNIDTQPTWRSENDKKFEDKNDDPSFINKSINMDDEVKAKTIHLQELEEFQSVFEGPKNFLNTLSFQNNMAQMLTVQGNHALAQTLFQERLEKLRETLEEDHPQVLTAHYNIASAFASQEKCEEASTLLKRVSETRRKSLGDDHLLVFMDQMAVCLILIKQGQLKEAVQLCNKAYEGQRMSGGDYDPNVIQVVSELAYIMYTNGMYEDSWNLHKRVEERQKEGHLDQLNTKHGMGLILFAQGKYLGAAKLFETVLEGRKVIHGDGGHPDVVTAQMNMALALEKHGKGRRALKVYNNLYEKQKILVGVNHPTTVSIQNSIKNLFDKQRNYTS